MIRIVIVLGSTFAASACTAGLEQDFELRAGFAITDRSDDLLFELENLGGNTAEPIELYRIELADTELGGGLFVRSDPGDTLLEAARDEGAAGMLEPGDVLRVREREGGTPVGAIDEGSTIWVNVMVLAPSQRSSDALTRSWQTVWSSPWTIGE